MAPPSRRSPFTAPGEAGRGLWRAGAEVTGGGLVVLLVQQPMAQLGDGAPVAVLVLLGVLALALLAVRRRFPVPGLLAVSAVLGALPAAVLPAAVLAYGTSRLLVQSRRRTAVLLASSLLTVLSCVAFAPVNAFGGHGFGLALGVVLAATTLIVPGLVGTVAGQQERLLRALRERSDAAEAARRLAESESRTHERSRIAAEMHDLVGHRLSLISLHTGGLEMALREEAPELREEAALVRRASGDAMRELREVLGVLGPLGRDTGSEALTDTTGTRADVETLAEETRGVGIPVELTWQGPDLDARAAPVRRAVHRVVRESLTNVHRYAAGADVTVAVAHTGELVEVRVRNGRPPRPPDAASGLGTGRGLVGLRERVGLLGGDLEAGPVPSGGFAVTARIPARPGAGLGGAPEPVRPAPEAAVVPVGNGLLRRAVSAVNNALGLAGVAGLMLLGVLLVTEAQPPREDGLPVEPRIGMTRDQMEDDTFLDDTLARAAATGREPPRAASVTSCAYPPVPYDDFVPLSEGILPVPAGSGPPQAGALPAPEPRQGSGTLALVRYCFQGDVLATIDRFTVPVVSLTPPWGTP